MGRRAPKSTFTTKYVVLRTLLVEARRDRGLTQGELAARLHRPQSFVSKYERGERRLDLIELLDLADALAIDLPDFIRRLRQRAKHADRVV